MASIKAGIVGGAGYTGGETIRLLLNHPFVQLASVQSRSQAGKPLYETHHDLKGDTDLRFTEGISEDVDVIFLCLGHGESRKFVDESSIQDRVKIIDLSQDFRLGESSKGRAFVYGLPELNREQIIRASNVANPGCFATAIQLGLLPLAKAGVLSEVFATGITGSTGAGQKLQDTTHFTWRASNISAYKTLSHQHMKEVGRTLKSLQADAGAIHFVPWRGDFTRGIYVSSCVKTPLPADHVLALYREFYASHPFTVVTAGTIDMKPVINTNKCLVGIEQQGDQLVVHTAIDNLLKGASGQAVQNMNLLFGLDETAGLKLKSIAF
ncbi:MAG TPA: N-acetyl-gamma-glutamyl-phosphate reductase [Chryseolinea sp.]|nr:N-acetyl-gamma-glutamyl-phosphate reductase [Chryseolinea sp.]